MANPYLNLPLQRLNIIDNLIKHKSFSDNLNHESILINIFEGVNAFCNSGLNGKNNACNEYEAIVSSCTEARQKDH